MRQNRFHLVLTAMGEPSLPLARLRAHNQLMEVESSTLRFDAEETGRFLDEEKIGGLTSEAVNLIHAKTEGWPAVLRIVAATIGQGQDIDSYIRGLSGALRPISTYLAEMLDGLPYEAVQFMLRIAILDRFSVSLCQAVTGMRSSRQLLEFMSGRQLLLIPLDEERRWYRYHALLAGYLRQKLEAEFGDEVVKLYRARLPLVRPHNNSGTRGRAARDRSARDRSRRC